MNTVGYSLALLVEQTNHLKQIRKTDVAYGDWVFVTTCNSVYSIFVLENGHYLVSGGWFDNQGLSPVKTTISGCTWGGSPIKIDALAACGLCLEFGNRVVTSPIQKVCLMRSGIQN